MHQEVMIGSDGKKVMTLSHLFFQMLKIGAVSWGGFMALISVVQKHFVEKERVIDNDVVLDGIALASMLPGPVAFNVVTFIGYRLRGLKGAFLAMAGILLPSFILMIFLSWGYFTYGHIPAVSSFFKGIYPAIAAIILAVAIDMSKKNINDIYQVLIAITAFALLIWLRSVFITLMVIVGGGALGILIYYKHFSGNTIPDRKSTGYEYGIYIVLGGIIAGIVLLILFLPLLCPSSLHQQCYLQQKISMVFSGLSLSLFGGGYVVIPVLENVFVHHLEWLSIKEFTDGIALGQVTPGPIFISATFIGYKVAGIWGAINATVFIFLPPALLMILFSHFLEKIKHSPLLKAAFRGLRPAVIGMIFSAVITIARGAEWAWISAVLFLVVLVAVLYYKVNVVYVIPLAGVTGLLLFR